MAIVDPDGRFLDLNPAYCAMTGFDRSELIGRPAIDLATDALTGEQAGSLGALQRGELEHFTFESHLAHRDGTATWINATVTVAHTADDRQFFIVAATDVGELVAQRRQLAAEEA